jgi:hypothetical protein
MDFASIRVAVGRYQAHLNPIFRALTCLVHCESHQIVSPLGIFARSGPFLCDY